MAANTIKDETRPVDPEDVLSESLQTLYDYAPITHSSAGSLFRYTLHPRSVSVETSSAARERENAADPSVLTLITPNTQAGNWALHASSIWTSAIFVADHLESLRIENHIQAAREQGGLPLRVLELGAGAGLPSIVIAKSYADVRVTASDYPDEELIAALEDNVRRNDVADRCGVVPYAWGSDPSVFWSSQPLEVSSEETAGFDVIVAADTLWNPDLHALFLRTLQLTLRRVCDARIHLVAGLHTGRYTLQAFMNMVEACELIIEGTEEKEVNGSQSRAWDVGRAEGEDEKERRRWIVVMKLKWKSV